MTGDPIDDDDEALAWAGDDRLNPEPLRTNPVESDVGVESDPVVELVETPAADKPMPAALLVTYGILAGLYLIYTLGWLITVTRSTLTQSDLLSEIMFQFGEFLAIASPAVWFAAVLVLTRGRRPVIRLLLLLAGLVATIPWPFLLGV